MQMNQGRGILIFGAKLGCLMALGALGLTPALAQAVDSAQSQKIQPYIESLKQKYGIEATPAPAMLTPPPPSETRPPSPRLPSDDPQVVQPYIQSLKDKYE